MKLILSIIYFLVVPILLGKLITYFREEKKVITIEIVLGYIFEFAILQLIALPLIFLKSTFKTLLVSYCTIIVILSLLSIILNLKDLKKCKKIKFNFKQNIILKVLLTLILSFLIFHSVYFTHIDDDDAYYVAQSLTAIETNTLYEIDPSNGNEYVSSYMRYALSPFPLYMSIASVCTGVHSTIIWHTILPGIMVALSYITYYLFGKKLLKDEEKTITFLIILSIINIYGNTSAYTTFSHLMLRAWQGKSVLINMILPFLWYTFFECIEENKIVNWIILYITILSACLVSGMGIVLTPISLGILTLVFSIKDKNCKYLLKSGIGLIFCVIYALIYILK